MTNMTQLARRAVACKGWRWMPGMLLKHRWAEGIRIVTCDGKSPDPYVVINDEEGVIVATVDEYGIMSSFPDAGTAYPFLPDLTDPATLGCLLALVREAWSDPGVSVWYDRRVGLWSWMAEGCLHSVHRPSDEDGYDTEAAALVAALEAAQ